MSTYYGLVMPMVYTGGVYIRSIKQTKTSTESGGVNEITSTLTNKKQDVFYIRNGLAADFKDVKAEVETLLPQENATAEVTSSGEITERSLLFKFGIPKGTAGSLIRNVGVTVNNTTGIPEADVNVKDMGLSEDGSLLKDIQIDFRNLKGENGAVVEATGMFGFYIDVNTGKLMLSYSGTEAPELSINENGELTYTYNEGV